VSKPAKSVILICLVAGSFLAGSWFSRRPVVVGAAPAGRRILYYHDPMHPAYKSDKPGIAPDCGMQLEPVYAGGVESGHADTPEVVVAGAVRISTEKQQLMGVRVAEVAKAPASRTIRALGRVALDATRVSKVTVAAEGWIRSVTPLAVGDIVAKDDLLATFYNRDVLTSQQTYLYALDTMDRFKTDENEQQLKLTSAQIRAAEENLAFLGLGQTQMREIARTRQVAKEIELRSPAAGVVTARNVYTGLRFDRGAELAAIADLSHVWVLVDLFGNEARDLRAGQTARVSVPGEGRHLAGKFTKSLPQVDAASRVLTARLELDNPGYGLKPDMFVDVEFDVAVPAGIVVPADAVADSGLRKTVFVDRGNGFFEPRQVETGVRLGDRVVVEKGLALGERIAVSGNFLIDSESRFRSAAENWAPAPTKEVNDPVCGMGVDPAKAARLTGRYKGTTYYFCSESCKRKFDANPERYVSAGGRPTQNPS
jgi:membrane fusion protein, copper/silver efflux system